MKQSLLLSSIMILLVTMICVVLCFLFLFFLLSIANLISQRSIYFISFYFNALDLLSVTNYINDKEVKVRFVL